MKHKQTPKSIRAVVLILVLWVLVVLTLLALTLAENTRLNNSISVYTAAKVQARWLARAGVYQAIAILLEDKSETDTVLESWYDNPELFHENDTLPGGTFTLYSDRFENPENYPYGIMDENSRLNLNTANAESMMKLPEMTMPVATAILSWQNRSSATEETMQDGSSNLTLSEKQFHNPYELSELPECTFGILYGEDQNLDGILENNENDGKTLLPDDNEDGILRRGLLPYVTVWSYERNEDGQQIPRININTASESTLIQMLGLSKSNAKWITLNRKTAFTSIADLLTETSLNPVAEATGVPSQPAESGTILSFETFRAIADRITVTDQTLLRGKININTASAEVLQTLPDITALLAERIRDYRNTHPEGFTSIADLLTLPGFSLDIFKKIAPRITIRSTVFVIRCQGKTRNPAVTHTVEAALDRGGSPPSILFWRESE